MIMGPMDTPYEGAFLLFRILIPPDYPRSPPWLKCINTGGARINPNIYASGKVCLSILGTWSGPGWDATQRLSSVLLSIQSLLCARPYHNEPGFEEAREPSHPDDYNHVVRHESLRAMVLEPLQELGKPGPTEKFR